MATLYERYTTGDDSSLSFYDIYWGAQTFSPSIAHKITSVKLLLFRYQSPGYITVSIRATDGSGHPTGADLCSGTTDGDTLTTDSGGEWREITLGAGYSLVAATKYAIVFRALDGAYNNYIRVRLDSTSPAYASGNYEHSVNSGVDWIVPEDYDFMFEDWGELDITIHEVSVSETLSLTESILKLNDLRHAETLSLTESLIKLNDLRHADTLALTEAMSIYKIINVIVSEALALTESLIKTMDRRFGETLTLTESLVKMPIRIFTDSISITEAIEKLFDRRFIDTITITDIYHKLIELFLSEVLTIKDCVIRWRWLDAIRNLASARCPKPSVREQTKIDDGLTGE